MEQLSMFETKRKARKAVKELPEKYRVIYTPRGAAREYSELAVNLATGCAHGCIYCYAPALRNSTREDFAERIVPRANLRRQIELDLRDMARNGDRRRVLFCFMTDAYQPLLAKNTRQYLELFREYDIAFQVLTKNGRLAEADFDLYSNKDAYASTIVFSDERTRQHYEPNAGTLAERIHSLKRAKELGIETWVSLEPVIFPDQALKVVDLTKDYTDHYKVGRVTKFDTPHNPDWRKFTHDVIRKLEAEGKDYYIKHSLRPYM